MKATKKLIGALVALIASLAISVGATFAWFTTSNSAKINTFELNVMSNEGNLFIGFEQTKLSQGAVSIPNEKIANLKLSDCTLDGNALKRRETSAPDHDGEATGTAVAGTHFLQFDLWFQADKAMDIYLTDSSSVTSAVKADHDIVINDTDAISKITGDNYGKALGADNKIDAKAENAVRVAFSATTDIEKETTDKLWEPNANGGFKTNNLAADYEQFLEDAQWPTPGTNAGSSVVGELTPGEEAVIITLDANVAKKVVVTIWLEGTDGDCLNSIFADVLSVNLQFAGKDKVVV